MFGRDYEEEETVMPSHFVFYRIHTTMRRTNPAR
jgi:hypothetical protein